MIYSKRQFTFALLLLSWSLALSGLPPSLGASSLETLNYARFYTATDPNVIYACANTDGTPCNGNVLAPGTNWTVNYVSSSSAGYGVLRGQASVYLTGDNSLGAFPSFVSIGGRAGFLDTLTITGGSGTGTAYFTFQVTGTSGATPGQSGRPQFQWVPVVNGSLDFNAQRNFAVDSAGTAVVSFPFTFNAPTEFGIYFYALAQIFSWVPGASAFADYSSTAILARIDIQTSSGAFVPNFSIQSASGTAYTENGAVLPVAIDIKPGEGSATINSISNGLTPVAILSISTLDAAASVDRASLTFGRTGFEHSLVSCKSEDVNGDGLADLLCFFRTRLTGFEADDTSGLLKGFTLAGTPISGLDQIRVIH